LQRQQLAYILTAGVGHGQVKWESILIGYPVSPVIQGQKTVASDLP